MRRALITTLTVLMLCSILGLPSCSRSTESNVTIIEAGWKCAIIRRVVNKKSSLIGVNSEQVFMTAISKLVAQKPKGDGVYVLLVGAHSLKEVLISDQSDLLPIAMQSKLPERFVYNGPWDAHVHSISSVMSDIIEAVVGNPDIIVVGTATSIVAEQHIPPSSTNSRQQTLFTFAIDKVLKTQNYPIPPASIAYVDGVGQIPTAYDELPSVIGVSVAIGSLPWQDQDTKGVGFRASGEIPLVVGGRYLLCLTKGSNDTCKDCSNGGYPDQFGLDVYSSSFPNRGVIAISNGVSSVPEQSKTGEWKLTTVDGKINPKHQLFNLKEDELIERISSKLLEIRTSSESSRMQSLEELRKLGAIK